jgi:hypothetical protein
VAIGFLGVEAVEVPDAGARSTRRAEPLEISQERRSLLAEAYRSDVERLATCHPEIDLSLWKHFA